MFSFLNHANIHLYKGEGGEGGGGREGGQQGLPLGWRDRRELQAQAGQGEGLVLFFNLWFKLSSIKVKLSLVEKTQTKG